MLGPFTTASRLTPIHQMSIAVLSRAACASMSTTTPTTMTTTTTTTRDRGDRYGPMEWAQQQKLNCAAFIRYSAISLIMSHLPSSWISGRHTEQTLLTVKSWLQIQTHRQKKVT